MCTFMVVWFWCFKPSSQVDGRSSLPGSMVTLQCAHKCCTKLYLVV
jgi:hypothetical protein